MMLMLAVVLLAVWALGLAFHIGGGLIHIALVLAVVAVTIHFVRRRNPPPTM